MAEPMQKVEITALTAANMRSKTPEVNEKMQLYFESMRGQQPDRPPSLTSEDIAHSERSVPRRSRHGGYEPAYGYTADPHYTMLPPEMRREDSNMRLEREVFGEDPAHYGGSEYLRSAGPGSRYGNGNGGENGYVGPRGQRERADGVVDDDGSEYAEGNGMGPQRVQEERRTGWDDKPRSRYAPSRGARSQAAHTAAGYALPRSASSSATPDLPMPIPEPATGTTESFGPLPLPYTVTNSPTSPNRERIVSQSSGPSFGNLGPIRESMRPPPAQQSGYVPLTNQQPPLAQAVHITIQPPTDPALSRGVVTPQPLRMETDDGRSERTAGTRRTGAGGRSGREREREEGEEWARREREREEMRRRETELRMEDLEPDRPVSPARTHRTQQTTRSILKQGSVHPSAMPLPLSGRTTPSGGDYQPFRMSDGPQPGAPRRSRAPSLSRSQYDAPAGGQDTRYGPPPAGTDYAPSQSRRGPTEISTGGVLGGNVKVAGGDVDVEVHKDGETVITVRSQAPPQERERAPSRASAAPPPPRVRSPLPPSQPSPVTVPPQQQAPAPINTKTPRTSYTLTPSALAEQVTSSHFHDEDLCVLLRTADDERVPEVVRRAVRRAVVKRMRKLGMEVGEEMLRSPTKSSQRSPRSRQRQRDMESPGPAVMAVPTPAPVPVVVNLKQDDSTTPPPWAQPLFEMLQRAQSRLDTLDMKLESSRPTDESIPDEELEDEAAREASIEELDPDPDLEQEQEDVVSQAGTERPPAPRTPQPQQQPLPQPNDISVRVGDTEITIHQRAPAPPTRESTPPAQDDDGTAAMRAALNGVLHPRDEDGDGDGEMEEELYKLRQKPVDRSDAASHRTWEIERDDGVDTRRTPTLPDLPASERGHGRYGGKESPPLPPLPAEALDYDAEQEKTPGGGGAAWPAPTWPQDPPQPAPWQRVHQRLLNWAIVWPSSELDNALLSTTRGHQVDEIALSIWTAQVYKRYVRARMTDNPPNRVDRLFVPPNMADAINNAVFNGRHGDACGMLRDLWAPFGLDGMPRLLVVLARHRRDENHWVVHRFSLPDGNLTTYDTYPERALPDGRPLGWWFAIRIAWPHAMYPHPDHLVQKMVRLHRPLQLLVDNSVAAAAIWRNILMGSKPERQVDLERLRDLVSSEVKNLRTRKDMGRLSISTGKTGWEDLN